MSADGWRTSLIAPGRWLDGRATQIVVGLVRAEGRLQVAIRVGERGNTALLPHHAAIELTTNLRHVVADRLKREGE